MAWAFVMLASACWMGTAGSRVTWPDASAPVPVTGAGALQGLLEVSEVQRPLVAIVDVSPDSLILAQDVWNDPQLDSLEIDLLVSVVGDRGGKFVIPIYMPINISNYILDIICFTFVYQ